MQNFRDLKVWENAHLLVIKLYKTTTKFPKEEIYGITNQIRRAAVSVPTNIAEGCGRFTKPDFAKFLQISMGSACEIEYLLFLSGELEFTDKNEYEELNKDIVEIKKMLTSLIQKVRA